MKTLIELVRRRPVAAAMVAACFAVGVWVGVLDDEKTSGLSGVYSYSDAEKTQHSPRIVASYDGTSLTGSYLASRFAESENDMNAAANNMISALRQDGQDITLLRNGLRILVAAGRMEEAAAVAEKILEKETHDSLALILTIAHDVKTGNYEKARDRLNTPVVNHGMYEVIRPILAKWVDLAVSGHAGGDVTLELAPENAGFLSGFLHYQLALMNDMAGQNDAALTHYNQAINDPQAIPYRLVQALSNYYLRQGQRDKAQEVFNRYARQNPASELIPDALPQGDKDKVEVVPLVETPTQGIAEILFTTASLLFGEEVEREALIYLQLTLYLRSDFPPAQLMLASLLEQMRDYEGAIAVYAAIDKETVFYRRGQVRTALNYLALENEPRSIKILQDQATAYPDDTEALIALGDIHRSAKRYAEAVKHYSQAIDRIETERHDHWSLYYARGIAYERAGEWDKAEADFRRALDLEPGQPDVLNYLGYSWLVQGEHIQKAQDYIEQALEQRPVDAHIIDSMGWAYYMRGDFAAAVEYLEQAAEITPQDPTINEHLGDAYWRVGREIEARFQWQRALQFEPENPESLKEKLESGLPAFEMPDPQQAEQGEKPPVVSSIEHPEHPIKAE